jgi:Putative antitoxin of bacterial toxin-antitoxin system, YdaS/YdaT
MKASARKKTPQKQHVEQAKEVMLQLRRRRGALSQLAVELGVTAQAVHLWEVVPIQRVLEVERITGIPRRRLRPDFFNSSN